MRIPKPLAAVMMMGVALAAIVPGPLGAQPPAARRPAPCHEHGRPAAPQPADTRCCLTGHDTATPQMLSFQTALEKARGELPVLSIPQSAETLAATSIPASSNDPPGLLPLRI